MVEACKVVAFTGHRPPGIGGYKVPNAINTWVHQQLVETITSSIEKGYTHFISGGALGVDQLAGFTVIKLRQDKYPDITLEIARPFPSQASNWPESSQEVFDKLCIFADNILDVSDDPYSPAKMQRRNEYMVTQADAIIAVWDGSSGGTGNCVEYAKRMNKPILHINPATRKNSWIINNKCG